MNRALAETLSFLNGLIAVVIVLIGLAAGYRISGGSMLGALSGGFVGFLFAALACGAIAYLALIEHHLSVIAGDGGAGGGESFHPARRRDPQL